MIGTSGRSNPTVQRLQARLRWIAVRGLASVVAGGLVLGIGGRLVMLASRFLHPESVGRFTENGNRIGEFTVGGTLELVLFGGLFSGALAGVVWVSIREWIPDNPTVVGLGAVAIGGFALVEADNPDFVILVNPRIDLMLLLALVFTFGVALHWFDGLLDRRLPAPEGNGATVVYALVVAIGAPLLIPTFGNFLSAEFCFCDSPPVWTGILLSLAFITSLIWWLLDTRGVADPPSPLGRLGLVSGAGAVVAGGVHLAGQVVEIL